MTALTFGQLKTDFGTVVSGGVAGTDPRVLYRTNAAMRALMEDVPQGIFVGSVMVATVAVTGNQVTLPPGMDVAFVVEATNATEALNGWFSIRNNSTFLDPDDIVDTVLVDEGFIGTGGARVYSIPELPSGTSQVNLWGLKAFTPVAQDADVLIVQNPRAVKAMIISLERGERYNDPVGAKTYRTDAVQFLVSELDRALTDPQRFALRLSQWRADENTFANGTLGNTYARVALDMQAGQRIGRFKISRLVYRALSWIFEKVYEYQLIERNRIKVGVPTLTPVPTDPTALVSTSSDATTPIQFEIIRQVVQALMAEDHQGLDDDRGQSGTGRLVPGSELTVSQKFFQEAGASLTRQLDAQLEAQRRTTYETSLAAYIAGGSQAALGYVASKLGLELTTGLKMSDVELRRLVAEASIEAVDQQNSLAKTDRYFNTAGPIILPYTYVSDPSAALPFSNYKVLAALVRAQLADNAGGDGAPVRAEAYADIARNLATVVDAARSTARYARLGDAPDSLGFLTAKFGLELPTPETALTYSDNQLNRWTNESAREALQQRNFLSRTERYSNLPGPEAVPFAPATTNDALVSYPDYEVLRRLVLAQMTGDAETARGLRAEAAALVERNLQKAIEAIRNQQWHCLLAANPFPQFGGTRAQIGLEFSGDGGADGYKLSDAYVSRVTQQAWSQAVDAVNFLSRTEDYEAAALDLPNAVPADDETVQFSFELIKLYAEALLCQDRNEEQRATSYKQQAAALVERNLVGTIERARRVQWEAAITATPYPMRGGAVAHVGLEYLNTLAYSAAKVARWVTQATQMAVSQYNFLTRGEDYEQAALQLAYPTTDDTVLPFPLEVIKLLTESLIEQDAKNAAGAAQSKQSAFDLIERNLKELVERARRTAWETALTATPYPQFGGAVAQIGLEFSGDGGADGYKLSDAYVSRVTQQAWSQAVDAVNFLSRTEDYEAAALDLPNAVPADDETVQFSFELIKLYAEALLCQDRNEEQRATSYKQQAAALVERNLVGTIERARRVQWEAAITATPYPMRGGAVAHVGLEYLNTLAYSAAKVARWVTQATQMAVSQYNFLTRGEDYEQPSLQLAYPATDNTVLPFPLEVIKLLTESLIEQDAKNVPGAAQSKQAAFDLIERNLKELVERARRTAWETALTATPYPQFGGAVAQIGLEYIDTLGSAAAKVERWTQQGWAMAVDHYNFVARRESYDVPALTLPGGINTTSVIPFSIEVVKALTESLINQDAKQADVAAMMKKAAFDLIERNLKAAVETARKLVWKGLTDSNPFPAFAGARAQLALEMAGTTDGDGYLLSDAYAARLTQQGWRQAADHYNFLARTEDYEQTLITLPGTQPADTDAIPFSFEIVKMLAEAQYARDRNDASGADAIKEAAFKLVERNLHGDVERTRRMNWETALTATPAPQLGGVAAQIGLEFEGTYELSAAKVLRWVVQAWAMAVDQYNFLSRKEDYEKTPLVVPSPAPAAGVIPFPIEIIKMLAESLLLQDQKTLDLAQPLKAAAFDLIQRNLTQDVEYGRRVVCEQQVALGKTTFGYYVGRLGLDLPNGLSMSDAKRRRLANKAEELLANSGRWKFFESEFFLSVDPAGRVVMPTGIERIISAEWCGHRLEVRDRRWFYMGFAVRRGDWWEGWATSGAIPLFFAGQDDSGNVNYVLREGCFNRPDIPNIRALLRLKWVYKANDTDLMLVQCYPAVEKSVLAELCAEDKDWTGKSIQVNSALKALDDQLAVETEGQIPIVTVHLPGLPHGGMRGIRSRHSHHR